MNRSRLQLYGRTDKISLDEYLNIPECPDKEKIKCRITYSEIIEDIEYEAYNLKPINSLKMVRDDFIDYGFKFKDRDPLNKLYKMRGDADEILVIKNGMVTDTSFSNIVFLKDGKWYTPDDPLLCGTMREYYIRMNLVTPVSITPGDLYLYEEARLINSMRTLTDGEPIRISDIF